MVRRQCDVFLSEKFVVFGGICGGKLGFLGLSSEEEQWMYVHGNMGEMPPEPKNTAWDPHLAIGNLGHLGRCLPGDKALGPRMW